jgi:hypothetical protein
MKDVARFYTEAQKEEKDNRPMLNSQENKLRDDLLKLGLLKVQNDIYTAPQAAGIISINPTINQRESYATKVDIYDHELNHALYFTNAEYRNSVDSEWNSLSIDEKNIAIDALDVLYDSSDNALLSREYAAYCVTKNTQGILDTTEITVFRNDHAAKLQVLYEEYKADLF